MIIRKESLSKLSLLNYEHDSKELFFKDDADESISLHLEMSSVEHANAFVKHVVEHVVHGILHGP